MTVGELIERLGRFDANLPVVIYEDTEMGDKAEVGQAELDDEGYWFNRRSGTWDTKRGPYVWLCP
jgi:hypothetical protein